MAFLGLREIGKFTSGFCVGLWDGFKQMKKVSTVANKFPNLPFMSTLVRYLGGVVISLSPSGSGYSETDVNLAMTTIQGLKACETLTSVF